MTMSKSTEDQDWFEYAGLTIEEQYDQGQGSFADGCHGWTCSALFKIWLATTLFWIVVFGLIVFIARFR